MATTQERLRAQIELLDAIDVVNRANDAFRAILTPEDPEAAKLDEIKVKLDETKNAAEGISLTSV